MTPRVIYKNIEKNQFKNFEIVSADFRNGAIKAAELEYFNAAGVLIVHAAIALADAITIKIQGIKAKGDNHDVVVDLLKNTLPPSEEKKKALYNLERIIEQKNKVSYMGVIYNKKDFSVLLKYFERFQNWAVKFME